MTTRSILALTVVLLGSAAVQDASAQRTTGRGERTGGYVRGERSGSGRKVVGSSRAGVRGERRGRDPGPYGRVGPFPSHGGYGSSLDHHRRYYGHHGLYVGAHFGSAFVILVSPAVYPVYTYVAPYSIRYSASGARTLLQGDLGGRADALGVDHLPNGIVRLTWRPDGGAVTEVGFFLADSEQRVLAVQTLTGPPFSALFEPTREAAYVGMTIAYGDGQTATTLLRYRVR